jgi:hypothetical protein
MNERRRQCKPERGSHDFDGEDRCACGEFAQVDGRVMPISDIEPPLARIGRELGGRVVEHLATYTVALWLAPHPPCSHARARRVPAGLWCPDCGGHRDA